MKKLISRNEVMELLLVPAEGLYGDALEQFTDKYFGKLERKPEGDEPNEEYQKRDTTIQ